MTPSMQILLACLSEQHLVDLAFPDYARCAPNDLHLGFIPDQDPRLLTNWHFTLCD